MKGPAKAQKLAGRAFFRPRLPALENQCASCPFGKGNDKEWGAVVRKLWESAPEEERGALPAPASVARARIRMEATHSGEFACHGSAYTADMKLRPTRERRQCPGATKWFKENLPK